MGNKLDALLIAFAVRWHPYGDAADEDIFTNLVLALPNTGAARLKRSTSPTHLG